MTAEVVPLRGRLEPEPELSDESLAGACSSGDPAAVAGLFDRFHHPVARYIYRLIGGGPDVDDLLQATFLEVARGQTHYDRSRGSVATWLFAIATNVVRHHRRSTARRMRLLSTAAQVAPVAHEDVADRTDARRQLDRARIALEALDADLREAFVLCELEGLSAKEAGLALGATEVAVWKRVSKARASLRQVVLGAQP